MNKKVLDHNNENINSSKIRHYSTLFIILFGFWLALSGRTDSRSLLLGGLTALFVTWATGPLLRLPSTDGKGYFYAFDFSLIKFVRYWFWLMRLIIKANIDLFKIIVDPEMPINPQIIRFKKPMENPLAHVVLGNSIILPPGTVTMDIEGGKTYVIHALDDEFAEALVPKIGEGDLPEKIGYLFGEDMEQDWIWDKGVELRDDA